MSCSVHQGSWEALDDDQRSPATQERVRTEAVRLAEMLSDASRRLALALEEKQRISRMLDQVLENLDTAVVLRTEEGRVLAANQAAQQLGVVEPGSNGEPWLLARCFDRSDAHGEGTFRPRGKGGPVWVLKHGTVPLPQGAEGRLLMVQDVSHTVRLEEQTARQTRLEALGRMAAEIAHEVRNPLGSLELFSALLVDELTDQPERLELAEQMLLGVRQLGGTVTHLLAAVRGRPLRPALIDLVDLARETAACLAPVAEARDIDLRVSAAQSRMPAAVDREGIRQVLLNLVGNGLEMTPAEGRVRIGIERWAGGVALEVADSGPGVPPELRDRIFEPFFTTRKEGTGLGLSVVERVALAHGGSVEVDDAPEGGALFRLLLPMEQPALGLSEEKEA